MTPHLSASFRTYLAPTHHHGQHCGCSGVIQIPGNPHLSGPEVGQSHRLNFQKAQQRLYFLHQLRGFNLPQELLKQFYSAVESVLCTSITVWFGSATKSETGRLQRTVRSAERIIGAPLPTLQELYTSRVRKRAQKITLGPSHSSHLLFEHCHLAGASESQIPGQPGIKTVFSPRQSTL